MWCLVPGFPVAVLGELRAALDGSRARELLVSLQTAALLLGKEEEALPAKTAFRAFWGVGRKSFSARKQ